MERWDTVVDDIEMEIRIASGDLEKITLWAKSPKDPKQFQNIIKIYLEELAEEITKLRNTNTSTHDRLKIVNIFLLKVAFLKHPLSNIEFDEHNKVKEEILENLVRGETQLERLLDNIKDEIS